MSDKCEAKCNAEAHGRRSRTVQPLVGQSDRKAACTAIKRARTALDNAARAFDQNCDNEVVSMSCEESARWLETAIANLKPNNVITHLEQKAERPEGDMSDKCEAKCNAGAVPRRGSDVGTSPLLGTAERLIDSSPEFAYGYATAMREVWDRLPMAEYLRDGLSERELRKLSEFVASCMPNNAITDSEKAARPEGAE